MDFTQPLKPVFTDWYYKVLDTPSMRMHVYLKMTSSPNSGYLRNQF